MSLTFPRRQIKFKCGGAGSHKPGPCPGNQAESSDESTATEAKVPGKLAAALSAVKERIKGAVPEVVRQAAGKFVAHQMQKYKDAFGEKAAKTAISAAGILAAVPLPGAAPFGFALVEAAYWGVRGGQALGLVGKALEQIPDVGQLAEAAVAILRAWYAEQGQEPPEISAEDARKAVLDAQSEGDAGHAHGKQEQKNLVWPRREIRCKSWEESAHPRADDGRFGSRPGGHGGSAKETAAGQTPAQRVQQARTRTESHPALHAATAVLGGIYETASRVKSRQEMLLVLRPQQAFRSARDASARHIDQQLAGALPAAGKVLGNKAETFLRQMRRSRGREMAKHLATGVRSAISDALSLVRTSSAGRQDILESLAENLDETASPARLQSAFEDTFGAEDAFARDVAEDLDAIGVDAGAVDENDEESLERYWKTLKDAGRKLYPVLRQALLGSETGQKSKAFAGMGVKALAATDDNQEIIDIPDIRQRDFYSYGACVAMAVGRYFKVGPETLDEWKKALGTTEEDSTRPQAIIDYLTSLGLEVDARQNRSLDDLRAAWQQGRPTIVCVREYGVPSKQTSLDFGHYVVVIGMWSGMVVVQDPSVDNVTEQEQHPPTGGLPEELVNLALEFVGVPV